MEVVKEELTLGKSAIVLFYVGQNGTLGKLNTLIKNYFGKKLVYPIAITAEETKTDEIGLSILLIK